MRSILILLVTILLLGGGFFVYFSLQTGGHRAESDAEARARAGGATTLPVNLPQITGEGGPVAGPGDEVWVKTFDEKTRQVAFQFRASRYDPKPDGDVLVELPQAELFTGEGAGRQILRIEGKSGRVVMGATAAQRGPMRGSEPGAPRRGELHDVTITLADESDPSRVLMRCDVNNIAFDNDTYRIATEGYHDGTRDVPADQVRVQVRGEDFDFDGRGLTIRWNEADRRLQLLEVAHGESLTIKAPELLRGLDRTSADGKAAQTKGPSDAEKPVAPAGARPQRPAPAVATQPGADPAPVYRASFVDAVHISRADALLASADQMLVDFISDRSEPVSPRAGGGGGAAPKRRATDEPTPTAAPDAAPAQPVVVRWTGKLRVAALEGDSPRPAPGSLNIAMSAESRPVQLNHQGMDVRCAAFDYRSGDDSLTVTSSPAVPVITLRTKDGATLHTPSIEYRGAENLATLRGPSRAELRERPADDGRPPRTIQARWENTCVLTMLRTPDDQVSIERAALDGDVHVDHPDLALRADKLDMGVRPDERGQVAMNDVKADGGVRCDLTDKDGAKHVITCDHLTAAPDPADAQGRRVTVVADGTVHAVGVDHDLTAGRVTLALAKSEDDAAPARPADRAALGGAEGQFDVESMLAQQDVKLALREGGGATGEQMLMRLTPHGTEAELLGQPATLSDGTNTLSGPHIKYEQRAQQLRVQGAGSLAFAVRDAPDRPARPVQVAWDSGLRFDGAANAAEVVGNANIVSDAPDGSKQIASSDRILITLADAPTDSPATAPVQASARQAPPKVEYFDLTGEKMLRTITLAGNAQVQSILHGKSDDEIRRVHLLAPQVTYDLQAQRGEVPSAGRMLIQDTLPPDPKRASEGAAAGGGGAAGNRMLGSFRGATAFKWDKDLVTDLANNEITMSGNVLIAHQEPQAPAPTSRVEAARVTLDLLPQQTSSATKPAAPAGNDVALFGPADVRLKALAATGDVRITVPQMQIDAHEIAYDALAEMLTAHGTDRQPVQLFDAKGVSRGSFSEVVWNTRTDETHLRGVQAQVRR